MGYYTRHVLKTNDPQGDEVHAAAIAEISGYLDPFDDVHKWYDMEDDLILYSKTQPEILFKVSGFGEENGDQWVHYFKNGESVKIVSEITTRELNATEIQKLKISADEVPNE